MKALVLLSVVCALALTACTDRDARDDAGAGAVAPDAARPADVAPADQGASADQAAGDGDAAALGLLATIDQHEIDAARQAKGKQVDGDVLAFAGMMETAHGANLQKTRTLGAAPDTPDITAMKQKGKAELDALATKSGDEYEKAYIEAMVKGHQEALAAIDEKMLPAATREDVRRHLADTREAVEMHLTKAQEIAGKL